MAEFAHSSLHQKIEVELASAFADVSSDEDDVDAAGGRRYEAPHAKVELRGWTKDALARSQQQRAKGFSAGQPPQLVPANAPFSRTSRLAATLVRAKNRFLLLHALSKLPRPLPAGWTPLHTACYVHDFQNLHVILGATKSGEVSAALQGPKVDGITPLHLLLRPFARMRARHAEPKTVEVVAAHVCRLLKRKANVNARATGTLGDVLTNGSGTPLHQAMDRVELMRALVDAQADVNARDNDDNTPLNMCFDSNQSSSSGGGGGDGGGDGAAAAIGGGLDAASIAFLLEHRADPNAQNNAGMNPLLRCTARQRPRPVLDLLVQARASLNVETLMTKEKPIHLAADDVDLVFHLIQMKADIDAQQGDGVSRLHMAVRAADDALCRRLLAHGADINRPRGGDLHATPLRMACNAGHIELLQTFLKTAKADRLELEWEGPSEADVRAEFARFKLKNRRPRRGQTVPRPTPRQKEVLKILQKHVQPCAIL